MGLISMMRSHEWSSFNPKSKERLTAYLNANPALKVIYEFKLELMKLILSIVVMESTGVYWKPLYNVWESMGLDITVAQAAHVKNVPERKTDIKDSHWHATLHRFGLVRPSFKSEEVFQRMRLLSRHRKNLTNDLATIKNRVQNALEDGSIKLGSIVSDVFGKSGLDVLDLIAAGTTNAKFLASAVTTKIKRIEEVEKALTNTLTTEHIFVIQQLMDQFHYLEKKIKEVESELAEKAKRYAHLIEK